MANSILTGKKPQRPRPWCGLTQQAGAAELTGPGRRPGKQQLEVTRPAIPALQAEDSQQCTLDPALQAQAHHGQPRDSAEALGCSPRCKGPGPRVLVGSGRGGDQPDRHGAATGPGVPETAPTEGEAGMQGTAPARAHAAVQPGVSGLGLPRAQAEGAPAAPALRPERANPRKQGLQGARARRESACEGLLGWLWPSAGRPRGSEPLAYAADRRLWLFICWLGLGLLCEPGSCCAARRP